MGSENSKIIYYKSINVDGSRIFYREGGITNKEIILLLHGFPSSSRMFENLIPLLADDYHVIAPDYPGFGFSEAPDNFLYTFDNLALTIESFTDHLHFPNFTLYVHDYGGPVGFRMGVRHPDKIRSLIVQNAVMHEEGLSPVWNSRRSYWKDHFTNEAIIRDYLHSIQAAQQRHLVLIPEPERISPNTWMDEFNFLQQPSQEKIQMDLIYDYRTNVQLYPHWQKWLRDYQPPTLIVWGKFDLIFTVEGANAFKKEVPSAVIHFFNAGHFALDLCNDSIAGVINKFLKCRLK